MALAGVLIADYAAAGLALALAPGAAEGVVAGALALAAVAVAALVVLAAWPRLRRTHEPRSPQLVRCPRCAGTFHPPLRAREAACPACGLVARFRHG